SWSPSMTDVEADAPGRVNLIGEHTDYQAGFVMPTVVPQHTHAALRPRAARQVHASSDQETGRPIEYTLGEERRGLGWGDYVQGVTWALGERGAALGGFDLRIGSDIPVGGGLSSSAALEIAALRAMRSAFSMSLTDQDLAVVGHRAETSFVGAPV